MRRVTLAAALATLAIAAAGCGKGEREQLQDYLDQANGVLRQSADDFKTAESSYKKFARGKLPPHHAGHKLARAQRSIDSARDALAALEPPEVAARLDKRLEKLFGLYVGISRQTTKLARYVPDLAKASRALAAANKDLSKGLRVGASANGQVNALDIYIEATDKVVRMLRKLRPPAVLGNANRTRIDSVLTAQGLAKRLRSSLESQDAVKTANLLLKFRKKVSAPTGAIDAGSLHDYNHSLRKIADADAAVRREEAHLAASLTPQ